ncbi:hypothetical protein LTR10_023367 [Elasticomyces elasticus]|uniref:Zn(2)-C6 fungal-type domain-containing protein n=1 Tax=Exophiala sideris TaxID=1016849 RepID=A0ABR0IV46_9EURO|nr:hypothetical protein LTR10_023367 [Elasticomyces elasticus]KAK5023150.1 hypothetical protein LTR13_011294 [Exophiala sideris]KAK5023372.1 hypothetical protein LTS07_009247 [Exophiala sideris]KAK5048734.1 hypothetical protein LTR69_011325 [Exophiala sideris]KAK5176136.1 hypothetical protein LTR44_011315 [Eurotiomycetes sp. CCFEE 6388]
MAVVDAVNDTRYGDDRCRPAGTQQTDVACANCAKSKTKCDRQYPCGRCVAKGLTCVSRLPRRGKEARSGGFDAYASTSTYPAAGRGLPPLVPAQATNKHQPSGDAQQDQNATISQSTPSTISVMSLLNQHKTTAAFAMLPPDNSLSHFDHLHDRQYDNEHSAAAHTLTTTARSTSQHVHPSAMERESVEGHPSNASRNPLSSQNPSSAHPELETWHPGCNFQPETFARIQGTDQVDTLGPSPMDIDLWDPIIFPPVTPGGVPQPSVGDSQLNKGPDVLPSGASGAASSRSQGLSDALHHEESLYDVDEDETTWGIDWEYWTICQCTPRPQRPPRDRLKLVLAKLDHNFLRSGPWSSIVQDWRPKHFGPSELFTNVSFSDTSRESLLVIAQRYVRLAVDVHGLALESPSPASSDYLGPSHLNGYIRLPPTSALHNYLELVLRNYEPFYPLLPARMLEPNHLTGLVSGRGPSLLLCFMIAFGSMIDPALKARRFSTAMTEICRHSMQDAMERDSRDLRSPLLYYSALMFVVKGAFGGDKAHMNICIAHRQLYLMSMRQAGLFMKRELRLKNLPAQEQDLERAWKVWVQRENISRLAYGWVLVEQEISLFYDLPPHIAMSEIDATLPADDSLWIASNAEEWRDELCRASPTTDWRVALAQQPDNSLRSLFQLFVDDQLDSTYQPQLLHMRLLLYPLHVLVAHLAQIMDDGFDSHDSCSLSKPITQTSSMLRSDEIRRLMHDWKALFQSLRGEGERFHALSRATLILYHLINLNLYTSFHELERFAQELSPAATVNSDRWIRAPEDALVHCGQIIRLCNEMKDELRPVWSAAAIYRATLVMWCFGVLKAPNPRMQMNPRPTTDQDIGLNLVSMDDANLTEYLRYGRGRPFLLTRNGTRVTLDEPKDVLMLGMETITHGPLTISFSVGVKRRLEALLQAWEHQHLTGPIPIIYCSTPRHLP